MNLRCLLKGHDKKLLDLKTLKWEGHPSMGFTWYCKECHKIGYGETKGVCKAEYIKKMIGDTDE